MDLFNNAKTVRLKSCHYKYLHAENDGESVTQHRNDAAKNNQWMVEFVTESRSDYVTVVRLKSCYNRYFTASNQQFLLGMTGQKVVQTVPCRLDSSVEWELIWEGNQMNLRERYGKFLRANGGLPLWRNSVTHDVTQLQAFQQWTFWEVDVVEIVVKYPAARPTPSFVVHSTLSESNSLSKNGKSYK